MNDSLITVHLSTATTQERFPHRQQGLLWGSSSPQWHFSQWGLNPIKLTRPHDGQTATLLNSRHLSPTWSVYKQSWSKACYSELAVSSPAVVVMVTTASTHSAYPQRDERGWVGLGWRLLTNTVWTLLKSMANHSRHNAR